MIAAAIAFVLGKRWMFIAAIVLALLGAIGVQTVRLSAAHTSYAQLQTKYAQLETTIANERRARAEQRTKDEETARRTEQQLVIQVTDTQREADEKESLLTARVAALTRSLHDRPERPAPGSPVAPASAPEDAHTGAGLYRGDSEFLVRQAATAAQIVIERDACYADYDAAHEALKKGQAK